MQTSLLLLRELNAALVYVQRPAAGSDITQDVLIQLLREVLVVQRLPQLLAQLMKWLQERPELLLSGEPRETAAAAAAAGETVTAAAAAEAETEASSAAQGTQKAANNAVLWQDCVMCVAHCAAIIHELDSMGSRRALDFAESLSEALTASGKQH
jgi:hypothetical protein